MSVLEELPTPLTGTFLIEASAGTGKTETVSDIVLRLIVLEKRLLSQILVVTFTEAATGELKSRVIMRLRQALEAVESQVVEDPRFVGLFAEAGDPETVRKLLTAAVTCFDEAAIFTIHGFCHKILQENAFESGFLFDLEFSDDQRQLVQEVVDDFWRIQTSQLSESVVRRLMDTGFSSSSHVKGPEGLALFVNQILNHPELEIIFPDGPVDLSSLEEKAFCQYEQLAAIWASEKENIERLFQQEKGLNRRSYGVAKIPVWMKETELFFSTGDFLGEWSCADKFRAESLEKACKKDFEPVSHPFFMHCSEFLNTLHKLNEVVDNNILLFKGKLVEFVRHELVKKKQLLHLRSFDDLLSGLHGALLGEENVLAAAIRKKFPVALVDEFQDTDQLQYSIFQKIYATADSLLFLIGDPKQAIYSFRGADIFTYMVAGRKARKIPLDKNWRSAPQLVTAVNSIFLARKNPFVFEEISFQPVPAARADLDGALCEDDRPLPGPFQFWFFERQEGQAIIDRKIADVVIPEAVAEEILTLLTKGREGRLTLDGRPLHAGDIAVIVRSNRETVLVRDALRKKGIPAVIHSHESLFATPEAAAVLRLLRAISDPGSNGLVRSAITTDLFGMNLNELFELFENEAEWGAWVEKFHDWHRLWQERGFIAMSADLLQREGLRSRLLGRPGGERQLTNLLHCFEVLHQVSVQKHLGVKSLLSWFARQVDELPEREEYQLRLETDRNAVNVITVHRSKGLGFPVVFCPYSWSGLRKNDKSVIFHDPEHNNRISCDLGSSRIEKHRRIMDKELLAENMRLLYVALTRAKHRCYLIWGAFKGAQTSALSYLLHSCQQPVGDGLEGLFPNFTEVDDPMLLADIEKMAARSQESIHVTPPPMLGPGTFTRPSEIPVSLAAATLSTAIGDCWQIGSFSSLTAARKRDGEAVEELETLDWKDKESIWIDDGEGPDGESTNFINFPRGTRAGICLHSILEKAGFGTKDGGRWGDLIAEELRRGRFDKDTWAAPVFSMLENVFSCPLQPFGQVFSLSAIEGEQRLSEMEFFFPVESLSTFRLADVFANENQEDVSSSFVQRLKNLSGKQLHGFLKGFIDLVFEHEGRFFLVDWKSNYLGSRRQDYHRQRIQEVMDEGYYHLQYHLYCLALHKYLQKRIPDYDYERHFGQVYYFFLRGIDPSSGTDYGIFQTRPPARLITNLERIFQGD